MTNREQNQLAIIKTCFNVCETPEERRQIFFAFLTDMEYPRSVICQALKDLGIRDDMTKDVNNICELCKEEEN